MRSTHSDSSVRVWDPFVRVFHWSLVSCVVLNYFVVEDGETAHQVIGYIAAGLVLARVVWGFVGSRYARFDDFFPTPARLRAQLAALRSGQHPFHPGHSPLGALMMFALMALVLALGVTGFLQTTDAFWGDERMQEIHELLASALIVLAGGHGLVAVVLGRCSGGGRWRGRGRRRLDRHCRVAWFDGGGTGACRFWALSCPFWAIASCAGALESMFPVAMQRQSDYLEQI